MNLNLTEAYSLTFVVIVVAVFSSLFVISKLNKNKIKDVEND